MAKKFIKKDNLTIEVLETDHLDPIYTCLDVDNLMSYFEFDSCPICKTKEKTEDENSFVHVIIKEN